MSQSTYILYTRISVEKYLQMSNSSDVTTKGAIIK